MKELLRWDPVEVFWETCVGGEREREREWRHALLGKMCSVPPTHSTPPGRKGKEFLVDFFPPVSCFLPPLPSYLSCSHLAAAIHHRISEPFKAQCAGMRAFRKASIIGFREVTRSLLNLLDSPSLVQAACTMERQGKEERRRGEKKILGDVGEHSDPGRTEEQRSANFFSLLILLLLLSSGLDACFHALSSSKRLH